MILCYGCKTEFDEIEECFICPNCEMYADEDDRTQGYPDCMEKKEIEK